MAKTDRYRYCLNPNSGVNKRRQTTAYETWRTTLRRTRRDSYALEAAEFERKAAPALVSPGREGPS